MMVAAAMEPASELAPLLHLGERDALASPIAYMKETKAWLLCPTIFCVIDIRNLGWCSKRDIGGRSSYSSCSCLSIGPLKACS